MRSVLHLSSSVETARGQGVTSNSRDGKRELPSLPAPGICQSDDPNVPGDLHTTPNRIPARADDGRETRIAGRNEARGTENFSGLADANSDGERAGVAKEARKPRIVTIHNRTVFRDCLVLCLELAYSDHEVSSFASIAEWLASSEPDMDDAAVVIVVVESVESSIADLELLETNAITTPVVVVSDTDDINHIVRVLKRGARGYIPTSLRLNVAVEALRLVKAGGIFIPASSIVPDGDELPKASNNTLLTKRQREIVEEIRHGKANKQIAYDLSMSEHTVKVHLRHIMKKLKARNRTEVAMRSGSLLPGHKDV